MSMDVLGPGHGHGHVNVTVTVATSLTMSLDDCFEGRWVAQPSERGGLLRRVITCRVVLLVILRFLWSIVPSAARSMPNIIQPPTRSSRPRRMSSPIIADTLCTLDEASV